MNKMELIKRCHRVSKEKGLPFNSIMIYYFLESILKELSKGKYKENFIFKGGFILSNVVGINARSTTDIDLLYKDGKFSDEKILEILDDSLSKKSDDDLTYIFNNI